MGRDDSASQTHIAGRLENNSIRPERDAGPMGTILVMLTAGSRIILAFGPTPSRGAGYDDSKEFRSEIPMATKGWP